jgi:hypothetical protein
LQGSCRAEYTAAAPDTKKDFVKLIAKIADETTHIYYLTDVHLLLPRCRRGENIEPYGIPNEIHRPNLIRTFMQRGVAQHR